jgi:tripartite-type tricarboxylate transporter receptor subunit TctC
MKLPRRRFLHLAAGAAALPAASRMAWAQAYPTRPVRIVVAFAPGGPQDILARLMGQWLSERVGQEFAIENKPGAAGNIGAEVVVNAPADGYTLLMVGPPNAINASLFPNLPFNFVRDIAPIAAIVRVPHVMLVTPSLPVTTVPEFIEYAKANSGTLKFASAGVGSGVHLAGEFFKILTGVNMQHVPYSAAPLAIADLAAGQVQVMFDTTPASVGYVKSGKLRALAVTTLARTEVLPNLPTVAEFVPGFEASSVCG